MVCARPQSLNRSRSLLTLLTAAVASAATVVRHMEANANRAGTDPATLKELTERVESQLHSLGQKLVSAYAREFVEYRSLSETAVANDVLPLATNTIRRMLAHTLGQDQSDEISLRVNADAAVRRMRQGVPLPVVLHAYRLWGQIVWAEIQSCVDPVEPAELRAAMRLAESVMHYVDAISSTVVQVYLEEQSGIRSSDGLLRRTVLDAMLMGKATTDSDEQLLDALEMSTLDLDGHANHTVVVFRNRSSNSAEADHGLAVNVTRHYLTNPGATVNERRAGLVGLREEEVVWILESRTAEDVESIRQRCGHAASEAGSYVVGIGRPSPGREGIAVSYRDAHAASLLALDSSEDVAIRTYRDVLLGAIISADETNAHTLHEILQPVVDYDNRTGSELLATIREYVAQRFHAANAANALFVKPNTVLYRLRKVRDLTSHDPMTTDGILLLSLAVKSRDFHAR